MNPTLRLLVLLSLLSPLAAMAADPSGDYAAQMAQAHAKDRPVASPQARAAAAAAVSATEVTYGEAGGKPLTGYLAFPVQAYAGRPAVLVFHEWWGLNDNIRSMTRQIAALGYAALAVDLYDGAVATTPDAAQAAMQQALGHFDAIGTKIDQAHAYLKNQLHAKKVGTIGWCFGGAMSYQAGVRLDGKLAAVVIYYGMVGSDPRELRTLTAPVLGLFAGNDAHIPADSARAFEKALKSLGRDVDVRIYEGAQHAFANPSGTAYQAAAAEDAWRRTTAFFARHLR